MRTIIMNLAADVTLVGRVTAQSLGFLVFCVGTCGAIAMLF